jgi:thiol-disulfide isomerase/thioredoxin
MKALKIIFLCFFTSMAFSQAYIGKWRVEMQTSAGKLPFYIEITNTNGKIKAFTINHTEKLAFDKVTIKGDSMILSMEVFDAVIKTKLNNKGAWQGTFTKRLGDLTYRAASLKAEKNKNYRFVPLAETKYKLGKKYTIVFNDQGKTYPGVAELNQFKNTVTGTFLTETGDYRYLEGNIVKDSIMLSCLEGNHAFLFKAKIKADSLTDGIFNYNMTGAETWKGKVNPEARLADPNSLTYLKPGYDKIQFNFKDSDGAFVNLEQDRFKNKVTIVQVLGTWCPNCMDETRFLVGFQNKNPDVEIVGLAFEKSDDEAFAFPKINKMKERFGVKYPVLIAGKNDKEDASNKLPMLNKIISFPTTIVIDKKGVVRKIHTGFSGPATGKHYTDFVKEFGDFIHTLQNE